MSITKNKAVTLTYKLHENDANGDLIEQVNAESPFVFIFGSGGLLPEFEQQLEGKIIGSTFAFGIKSANAYGEFDDSAMEYVPKEIFVIDGKLAEEMLVIDGFVNLRDQNGSLVRAKVIEVNEAEVLLDFNHPLAGVDLYFSGDVLDVRDATEEELDHGHIHGPGGHEH